jgi:hypothetical protein
MKPIAVFYHCKIDGEGIPNPNHACNVMEHQMSALRQSGLSDAAQEIHVGINGTASDSLTVAALSPDKAQIYIHGPLARTEIPTMQVIYSWARTHPDWYLIYHHTKGVTHPGEHAYDVWRQRMEDNCVWNWRQCVADLDAGYDAVGCHWLTPERYAAAVTSPFFGGTFWWSKSKYILQLPKLPAPTWENRFEAESWIGRRRPYPVVRDYFPGWP